MKTLEEIGNNPTEKLNVLRFYSFSWKVYIYTINVVILLNKETNLIVLSASPHQPHGLLQ